MKFYLAFRDIPSGDKGRLEGAVCSFLLTTWLVGVYSIGLGRFPGGGGHHLVSRAVWLLERRGAQQRDGQSVQNAWRNTFHRNVISFSIQEDCSPSGNCIRPVLWSFRNSVYTCISRCSFWMIVVSLLFYRGAACAVWQCCPRVLWRRSHMSVTS